jgi:membrane fusion protein (multidrug efflux system)
MKIKQRYLTKRICIAAVLGLFFIGMSGVYMYHSQQFVSTDDAAIDGKVVILSPKVSGYIKNIYTEDNQRVHAGDVIIELDPTDYQTKLESAQASLTAAQAALETAVHQNDEASITAPAKISEAYEQMQAAQATWKKASLDKQRMHILAEHGACSQKEMDQAIANEGQSRATVNQYAAELQEAQSASEILAASHSKVEEMKSKVKQAEAAVAQAENDLQHTRITAPVDGRITKRSIEVGSYVDIGTQLCSIVSQELWITANFKENQIKKVQPGCRATIAVDAYPHVKLTGTVDSFQAGTGSYFSLFPAENATGNFIKTTQRIPVKIKLDPPSVTDAENLMLGPGMSVVPTVYVKEGYYGF